MQEKILFDENQKFKQPWLWIGFFFFFILQVYGLIRQLIFDKPFGNNPASDTTFIFIFISYIVFLVFFYSLNLSVKIQENKENILIRFFPLQRSFHKIRIMDIKKYYVRTYNSLIDYGGWGIRYGLRSKGLGYNVSGNKGLQMELLDGKKIFIGSQKPEEFKKAIDQIKKRID